MKFHLTYTLLIKRGFKDKRITKKEFGEIYSWTKIFEW